MSRIVDIQLLPELAESPEVILKEALLAAGWNQSDLGNWQILKRSIDARGRKVLFRLRVALYGIREEMPHDWTPEYKSVTHSTEIHIIGAGPAGLFAALYLLEKGVKPIIHERGKDVRNRRRDLALLNRNITLNPESNYCFGEGGAGTYSDGKLYTRSSKRGDVLRILQILRFHGAPEDILIDAHPHIGTNKLPDLITHMREIILQAGGEIHFNQKLTRIEISGGSVKALEFGEGNRFKANEVVLATGHSARDVFRLLHESGVLLEAKPLAIGIRIEHPQTLIDKIQYHQPKRSEALPPASYNLVQQVKDRGVYSFCMCPGGIIAPCATSPGEVVTNGWSPSKRNNPWANSGIVVEIRPEDYDPKNNGHPLAALEYQSQIEKKCCEIAGGTLTAPAQRMCDFSDKKVSPTLPDCSYRPGTASVELRDCLPKEISGRLAIAFKEFGKKMHGFYTNEAIAVAPESRSSSPVRIPRDRETLQHPGVKGLYSCGEGAGYAGGIVSAAMDGERIAEKICEVIGV